MNPIPSNHKLPQPSCGSIIFTQHVAKLPILEKKWVRLFRTNLKVHLNAVICQRKPPKYLRYPCRNKLPPDSGTVIFRKPENDVKDHSEADVSPREIRSLPAGENVSSVLNKCSRFLRKGSLSMTIRELGHMGLPERALQTFCWAQEQAHLFPDDRILSATVEILARTHELKLSFDLEKFISLASRGVLEALARGFITGGSLDLAWKLLSTARKTKRVLDSGIYAKLILELGKNPDRESFVISLLEELSERDSLNLRRQDCTAIMKVCSRLQKFEVVENLFDWFRSGNQPCVIMYTTVIHSRFLAKKYRDGLALVWEMESLGCLFDMSAYRVVIKLFVALNDLPRAMRYFSKMREEGFSPTYDLYREMIHIYLLSGRLAKCKELCKEAELAGFKLEGALALQLSQLERSAG
ncbi:hypothetical protein Cgig2_021600 [Carnegiea gigantea]|uniref:Pentatricopeptide repeat-containing protein n=1 Tax=Carnegiea gigantea TaxID=171969 RepID=A0A9Q1GIB6_9CARY|nr:hypothetical protein Cgig2_021600 [Carnegiea gigantea]